MNTIQEKLINRLLELCDSIIGDAYVVTDGLRVSAIVLDKKIAEFLCKEMRKKYNTDAWVYLSIPESVEYAFSCGRECAFEEISQVKKADKKVEQPVDVSTLGEENGEDKELRESNVQSKEESS